MLASPPSPPPPKTTEARDAESQILQAVAPDGQTIQFPVPAGSTPGQMITVATPAPVAAAPPVHMATVVTAPVVAASVAKP